MDGVTLREFVGRPSAFEWSRLEEIPVSPSRVCIIAFSVYGREAAGIGHELVATIRASQPHTFQSLYELLLHLISLVQKRGGQVSVSAGFLGDKKAGWISFGGTVSLKRREKFGTVISGAELGVKVGSIKTGDVYFLATNSASHLVQEIKSFVGKGYQLEAVSPTVERLLRTEPTQGGMALGMIEIGDLSIHATAPPTSSASNNARIQINDQASDNESSKPDFNAVSSGYLGQEDGGRLEALSKLAGLPVTTQITPGNEEGLAQKGPHRLELEDDSSVSSSSSVQIGKTITGAVQASKSALFSSWFWLRNRGALIYGFTSGATISFTGYFKRVVARLKPGSAEDFVVAQASPGVDQSTGAHTKKLAIGTAIIAALLVILSMLIAGFMYWQRGVQEEANVFVQPFTSRLEQANELARLDPIRGREQLQTILEDVRTAQAQTTPGTAKRSAVDTVLTQAESSLSTVIGQAELIQVPIWLDLQQNAPGFVTSSVESAPGYLVMIDQQLKKAFRIALTTQEVLAVSLEDPPAAVAYAVASDQSLLTLGSGIHAVNMTDSTSVELKSEGDSDREGTLLGSYESYIYVFNPIKRNIYRYIQKGNDLSDPIGWLVSPLGVPADQVHDMAVDGDVWLSTKNGEIKKYTSGRATSFAISDLIEPLEGPLDLIAQPEQTYLYVFVPNQGRVVVLTKEGVFVKQIKSDVLAGATGVAVDEPANQLYAVSGSVVYQVPIL